MEDKEIFEETAQKLVDYDYAYHSKYQTYDIEFCPKLFSPFRIAILVVIVAINMVSLMLLHVIPMNLNVILLVILVFSFIYYKRKVDKKNEQVKINDEIINSAERIGYIDVLNKLADKHQEWHVEKWWNAITGLDMDIEFLHNYYIEVKCNLDLFTKPFIKMENENKYSFTKYFVSSGEVDVLSAQQVKERFIQSNQFRNLTFHPYDYDDEESYVVYALCEYLGKPHYEIGTMAAAKNNVCPGEEDSIENNGDYNVKYIDYYEYEINHLGYVIYDYEEKNMLDIFLLKQFVVYYFKVRGNCWEDGVPVMGEGSEKIVDEANFPYFRLMHDLREMKIIWDEKEWEGMDYLAIRPKEFTLEEWGAWMFAHISEEGIRRSGLAGIRALILSRRLVHSARTAGLM